MEIFLPDRGVFKIFLTELHEARHIIGEPVRIIIVILLSGETRLTVRRKRRSLLSLSRSPSVSGGRHLADAAVKNDRLHQSLEVLAEAGRGIEKRPPA